MLINRSGLSPLTSKLCSVNNLSFNMEAEGFLGRNSGKAPVQERRGGDQSFSVSLGVICLDCLVSLDGNCVLVGSVSSVRPSALFTVVLSNCT